MDQAKVLIVDAKSKRATALRDAVGEVTRSTPVLREDGESAVLWLAANPCEMCILSYELPGITGLETLAKMRIREPDLPAIIFAESKDQSAAVAAFRAGVIDFIPATGNFTAVIAERVSQTLNAAHLSSDPPPSTLADPTLSHIPPDRLAGTYQNRLRSIGRQLDLYQFHSVTILEVEGGFLVRAQKQRSRRPQALEFPDSDFPRLVASAISEDQERGEKPISQGELTPTGYEDLLRALGYRLDEMTAEAIVITELDDAFVVSGRGAQVGSAVPAIASFKLSLEKDDVDLMLNDAFRRRGQKQQVKRQPAGSSGGLRGIIRRIN
jgi:DNA-binding NarL/FixJ family response regulator